MTAAAITERLLKVVRREITPDAEITSLVRLTGGAAKQTYAFTVPHDGGPAKFILQLASKPAKLVSELTPRLSATEDAALMRAAEAQGVLAPRVRAVLEEEDQLGPGFVTDFVEGEVLGRKIVHDEEYCTARKRLVAQCAENLASAHRIPAGDHPYLRVYPATAQIDAFSREVAHYGVRTPELAYCFAWAREHAPENPVMTVVHGDFRMGNLLTDRSGLRCVLDWEVAHLGDPMQDLAWLCVRTWRFGGRKPVAGIGEREELFAAYEAAGGRKVDRDAVRFWEAWGNVKWAVMALRKGLRFRESGEPRLEESAIGRRMEEPLWDFFQLVGREVA